MKRFPIVLSNIEFAAESTFFSFTFVDAVTVANSVFTIFQVISATDQFERETRREQGFQVKVRKTRTNVNELHLAEAKSLLKTSSLLPGCKQWPSRPFRALCSNTPFSPRYNYKSHTI